MKKFLITIILGILLSSSILLIQLPEMALRVYFLDVGQGDSAFIVTPNQYKILVDAGPDTSLLDHMHKLLPAFDHEIDLIILTHPHRDHIYGFLDLMQRYKIHAALITGISYPSNDYKQFLELLNKYDIPVYFAANKKDFYFNDGVLLDILAPKKPSLGRKIENLNNDSIVFKLIYGDDSVLFTGDSELEAEEELLMINQNYSADVVKIGHHGSRTSTSAPFLNRISPNYAVISSGIDNKFKHPHPETLKKLQGVELFRTDLSGSIKFELDGQSSIKIQTER